MEFEVASGVGEGVVGDEGGDVGELRLLGFEEFAPGRSVEEEVTDGDGGADGDASGVGAEDVAAGDLDEGARVFQRSAAGVGWSGSGQIFEGCGGSSLERDSSDGGDGGEGLAAEAESRDGEEVIGGAELGGGVSLKGEEGVIANHADAIIGDADKLAAASLNVDTDSGGLGVEGVLKELLDDGGWTFDDLASGDLVGYLIGEDMNAAHAV